MEFKHLVEAAEKWCSGNPFDLIFAEEEDERRLDFYAEPGISFYVLCPDNLTGGTDNFVSILQACGGGGVAQLVDRRIMGGRAPECVSVRSVGMER